MDSVLLDTSFLICLSTDARAEHATAKAYFKAFIERGLPMTLSTIAISEYEVRQRISDLGLHNFFILPFNIDHAVVAATVFPRMMGVVEKDRDRVALKDDAKLVGQAVVAGISHFITADQPCWRRVEGVRRSGVLAGCPTSIGIHEPFSPAWFEADNQVSLPLGGLE